MFEGHMASETEPTGLEHLCNFLKFLELKPIVSDFLNAINTRDISSFKCYFNAERSTYVAVFGNKVVVANVNDLKVECGEIEIGEVRQILLFQRLRKNVTHEHDGFIYLVLVTKRAMYFYKLGSDRDTLTLHRGVSLSDGEILHCSHDPHNRLVYVFSTTGRVSYFDENHLHSTKQMVIGMGEISAVERIGQTIFLVGSITGSVELVDVSAPRLLGSSISYFYELRRITAIRAFKPKESEKVAFAARNDKDQLFVYKFGEAFPRRILNIDPRCVDVRYNSPKVLLDPRRRRKLEYGP